MYNSNSFYIYVRNGTFAILKHLDNFVLDISGTLETKNVYFRFIYF